ncbi:MAG: carbon-nitrogen hydrolase [Bacteroidales bacterium]|nr:carbon-nitrogen hydrolase [Bacteroidales bacterium]
MKEKPVTLGLVQMSCGQDSDRNMGKALSGIKEAADKGAGIVCLQELFSSRYFCSTEDYTAFNLAEPVPGPKTDILQKIAAECRLVIVVSLFEKAAEGLYYNTAAVIDADGTYLGKYRKAHIPDDPGYYEKFYFAPGDTGYKVFKTRYASVGVLICWDQWYPEAARITSLMGAEILFYPTAIGWAVSQTDAVNREQFDAWMTVQRAHAISNGVHVVAVNRTGREDDMIFWGGSFVAAPFGQVIYQASQEADEVGVIRTDLSQTGFYRRHWPFLRDRRIDTYDPVKERYIEPKDLL